MSRVGGALKMIHEGMCKETDWTVEDIPDLTGKVILVTGGNTGIGFETAKALLNKNAKVYIGARSPTKANEAVTKLKQLTGNYKVDVLLMDLADLPTIKKAVTEFEAKETKLHILFNNAGVMLPDMEMLTTQGYDLQFGVNVLGHYYLTKLLVPILERTATLMPSTDSVRIIETSSDGHLVSPTKNGLIIDYETLILGKARSRTGNFTLYAQSKSGNILVSSARARLLKNKNIASMSVHPGHIRSELQRHSMKADSFMGKLMLNPTPLGAITQLYAGTAPENADKSGKYFIAYAREKPPRSDHVNNIEAEDKLISWLEEQLRAHNLS